MAVHILGIRHHGPGSARNVKDFLDTVKPDIVLVEGPPEADGLLQWVSHEELKPPVAILVYQPDDPQESSFYPFAEFSPEWQAILYAQTNKIPVRFMDLPAAHSFAIEKEIRAARKAAAEAAAAEAAAAAANDADNEAGDDTDADQDDTRLQQGSPEESGAATSNGNNADTHFPLDPDHNMDVSSLNSSAVRNSVAETYDTDFTISFKHDPISHLAAAAGFADGEKWWEHTFEHRHQSEQVFEAVGEAMHALRDTMPSKESRMEQLREAYMRKCIRQAEREMFTNIVVICGAWHAPALQNMPKQKEDNDLLKGLPKVKIDCTWVPWTFSRLSFYSGYGAGIFSPGWYDHIWHHPDDDGTRWMAKVAQLFRSKGMDTSVAHVIEAVRLAESLAVLRQLPRAGLEELNEATWSVLCNGENMLLDLIKEELIVSNRIGDVPEDSPKPPLLLDIERTQKRLRLPAAADWKDYTLDLRKENDLERSIFLHRLLLLGIRWGQQEAVSGKGTFKEQWRLQWQPEMSIDAIDKGSWGNTVSEAAEKYTLQKGKEAGSLADVCSLLQQAIPAELPLATAGLIHRINNLAAASGDVVQLMEVIPPLVSITRYGNVRKTDSELVLDIVDSMVTRICVSLPAATTAINEEAAQHLMELFFQLNDAVNLLQADDITRQWQEALQKIAASLNSAPVLGGYATRLLADRKILEGESLIRAFRYAMSSATAPAIAAAWLEGFLKGSGMILLIDQDLWDLVNDWVSSLGADMFKDVLPLLRRTFANYTQPERKKLGEKARTGSTGGGSSIATAGSGLDHERGQQGIPVVLQLLGFKP